MKGLNLITKDDMFLVVHRDDVLAVRDFFNSKNPDLQVTVEEEVNGSLNYMDMTVSRIGNILKRRWYQKPTTSGRCLNFTSVQPIMYKKNVITNLAQRIVRLSDMEFVAQGVTSGKELLIENCYPALLINQEFKKVMKKVDQNRGVGIPRKTLDFSKVISLPYVPFLSEKLAVLLKRYGFFVAHKQYNNLSFLM